MINNSQKQRISITVDSQLLEELNDIHQALQRNPAERISLNVKVKY
jgi:metal-responsive CopG/Arc/MetJ family transcriptional regulator